MAARQVGHILKGANPDELLFEQASTFAFEVNLQAAKAQDIRNRATKASQRSIRAIRPRTKPLAR